MHLPRKRFSLSFQSKVLLPVITSLIALPGLTLFIIDRHIESQAKAEAQDTLATSQAIFENSLEIRDRHLRMRLENAVKEPRFKSTVMLQDPDTTRAFLRDTLTEYASEVEIALYTPFEGSAKAGIAKDNALPLDSFERHAKYGIESALAGETYSALIVAEGQLFEAISIPVFISNRTNLLGALTIASRLGKQAVDELKSLTRTEVMILAGDRPIASSLPLSSGRQVVSSLFSNYASLSEEVFPTQIDTEHYHFLAGEIRGLSEKEGTLRYVLLSSYENRLRALAATRATLLGICAAGIFLSVIITWILIRNITRPLRALRDGAEAVGRGDFSTRVESRSRDECGELAQAFNRMTSNVQQSRNDLEKTVEELKQTQTQLLEREARLRESEEGLRLIIEGARDHAIFTLNSSGKVLRWNNASSAMLGYSADEAKELPYSNFFDTDSAKNSPATALLEEAADVGIAQFEGWRRRKDGTCFWADVTLSKLDKVEGCPHGGFVEITRDITARKQAEEAMRHARDAAEASDRAKSEFLANMSHEVRTPMNGIIGMSSLLLDHEVSDEQRDYIETIRSSADSMLVILDDILDLSKIESGQMDITPRPVNLVKLIEESVSVFQDQCARRNDFDLTLQLSENLPGLAETDGARLRKVLINVIGNAVRFTSDGHAKVDVFFDAKEDILSISVADTGIGIPPDKLETIFEPFFQIESSFSREYGGTGLGLAIARNIVELLGGDIRVESELGQGSIFTLAIRIKPIESESAFVRLEESSAIALSDRPAIRDSLANQLSQWGIDAIALSSSPKKLAATLRARSFDALIIEESAARPDTLDLLDKLAEQERVQLPKIVRIASKCPSDSDGPCSDAYLQKPLLPSQLNQCLRRTLKRSQASAATTDVAKPAESKKANYNPEFSKDYPLKILVVEDNAINVKVLSKILRKLGYEPAVATNGEKGFQAAESAPFDFVFMDLQMPVMDGIESAKRILQSDKINHPIYISAFTANAHESDRENCDRAGFHDFVSKPARPNKIKEALKRGHRWIHEKSKVQS